jgi:hypothetical protein
MLATGAMLSACGRDIVIVQAPETTTTTTTTTFARTTPVQTPYESFIDRVHYQTSMGDYLSDSKINDFGDLVCKHYRGGGTAQELVTILYNSGVDNDLPRSTMEDFAAVAGIAVAELCPEFLYMLSQT